MIKRSATRLVKYLAKKSPDEIARQAKDKDLGKYLDRRSIKTLDGGAEGVTEIRGNKNLGDGVEVKKYFDLDSPAVSLSGLAEKIRISKQLSSNPSTSRLFTKHVPGSFKANKKSRTAISSSEYSPNTKGMWPRDKERAVEKARKVTGKKLTDVVDNMGNARDKVIDFMSPRARKGGGQFEYLQKMFERKKRGASSASFKRQVKNIGTRSDLKKLINQVPEPNPGIDDAIRNFRDRRTLPNAKGYKPDEYNKQVDKYIDKVKYMNADQRLTQLKKRHHSKS